MTSRQLKLLTASTAFIAVAASGANAATISSSTPITSPIQTSSSLSITSNTQVTISTGNAAVEISGTVGSPGTQTLNVSSGVVLQNNTAAAGTVAVVPDSNVTGVTINNSGTIQNLNGTGKAIDFATTDVDGNDINLTLNNTGTISGSVVGGSGNSTYTATNATQRGNVIFDTGDDTATFTSSTMVGDMLLGGGDNTVTISRSSITGGIFGASTTSDTITINNSSTVTGDIDVGGAGAGTRDALTVDNSRINGNIIGGNGIAQLTLTNAVVSGTINLGNTADGDTLTINGANTFTTMGTISNVETVTINANTVLNHAMSDVNSLTVNSGKTLTANTAFGTAGLTNNGTTDINANTTVTTGITNAGTLNIAAGKVLQAATYSGTAGTVGINVSDSTTAGRLTLTGGAVGATSVSIALGANAGYIASGTTYTIASGNAAATTSTLITTGTGVYRYALSTSTNDVLLRINRVSNTSLVNGSDNTAAAAAIEQLGAASTGNLKTVQTVIGQQTTAQGVEDVIESLTPSIDGVGAASVGVTVDTGNQISNRLASVRSTSGVATGDPMASKHMWMQGFGSNVSQDDRNGNAGYDSNSGGVSIGVDTDTLVEGVTTGVAFSYGRSTVDSNASSNASADIDTYFGTIYGSRVFDNGLFFNGQIGGGYNKYDLERTIIGVGKSKGDTDGFQGMAKVEAGRDYAVQNFTLTPLASLQYTYLDMASYTETGAGGASLRVNPEALSTVDAGVGGQVAYAMALNDGGTLKPSAHAKYIYRMGDDSMGTTSSFVGGGAAFNTAGVKADRSSVNLGAGVLLTTVNGTDLSLNYDADIRSNLTGHTGQIKARWAF